MCVLTNHRENNRNKFNKIIQVNTTIKQREVNDGQNRILVA